MQTLMVRDGLGQRWARAVTRFVIEDTIEVDIYRQNQEALELTGARRNGGVDVSGDAEAAPATPASATTSTPSYPPENKKKRSTVRKNAFQRLRSSLTVTLLRLHFSHLLSPGEASHDG